MYVLVGVIFAVCCGCGAVRFGIAFMDSSLHLIGDLQLCQNYLNGNLYLSSGVLMCALMASAMLLYVEPVSTGIPANHLSM